MLEGIEWLKDLEQLTNKNIICLVDGEHYPPVTEWAVQAIKQSGGNILGLVFLGGTEKISDKLDVLFDHNTYPLYYSDDKNKLPVSILLEAIKEQSPELVIDLSDVPVVDYKKRFKIASLLLSHNISYAGADFIFRPPAQKKILTKPSVSIIGTGKRIGKTAVSVTVSRILKKHGIKPAVVAMGRGGPSKPVVLNTDELHITPDSLLEVVNKGEHAASDYWENAILSGVPAIGCRRCGGGLAGNPFISNVEEGARIADKMPVDLVIMEGSGPTFPPVETDAKILVMGAHQPIENITGYLDNYRLLIADLLIVTMCEEPTASELKIKILRENIQKNYPGLDIALTVFRPEPLGDIRGKNVFLATTAPDRVMAKFSTFLEKEYECSITSFTTKLSNRVVLKEDLRRNLSKAEVLLTEIKAASIDVAVKEAKQRDMEIVFMHNRPELIGGTVKNLDESVLNVSQKVALERNKQ